MRRNLLMHRWLGRSAVAGALVVIGACTAGAQVKNPIAGDPIAIDTGKVAGTVLDNGAHAYLGIPFGAPPVGDLRWHAPDPVKHWSGIYDASYTRPACAQRGGGPDAEKYSEDCLYLNVWTPPTAKAGAKLPVLVFIYGGGFGGGSANSPGYAGAELTKKGVIRVNIAYRVGIFGYFALPELSKESGHNASGDWGSLDTVAAMQWVQRNIAAFGGDPANVTLMGQSAGSESVYQLQASPLGRGLFAKVSGWSGADLAPGGGVPRSLAEGEAAGLKVEQQLNFKSLAEMRAVPWEDLLTDLSKLAGPQQGGGGGGFQTRPIVDGYFLPDVPDKIFKAGKENDVPNFSSSAQEDLGSAQTFYNDVHTVAELKKVAADAFGDQADAFLKLFPASNDEEARKVALIVSGDTGFGISNRDWARDQALVSKKPVYLAQWAHPSPPNKPGLPPARAQFGNGATHGSDITFWMGNFPAHPERAWTDYDRELSDKMQDSLVAFARTGNPNTSAVKVPRYDPNNEERVVFGDTIYIEKMNTAQVEFLRAHAPKRGAPGGGAPGGGPGGAPGGAPAGRAR